MDEQTRENYKQALEKKEEQGLKEKVIELRKSVGKHVKVLLKVHDFKNDDTNYQEFIGILKEITSTKVVLERSLSNGRALNYEGSDSRSKVSIIIELDQDTDGLSSSFFDPNFITELDQKETSKLLAKDIGPDPNNIRAKK